MEDVLELMIPILAIMIGGLIVLLPIAGLTARFVAKPIVEMIVRARQQGEEPSVALLERRCERLELQVERLDELVGRLVEEREFERRLAAAQGGALPSAAVPGERDASRIG